MAGIQVMIRLMLIGLGHWQWNPVRGRFNNCEVLGGCLSLTDSRVCPLHYLKPILVHCHAMTDLYYGLNDYHEAMPALNWSYL